MFIFYIKNKIDILYYTFYFNITYIDSEDDPTDIPSISNVNKIKRDDSNNYSEYFKI